MESEQIKQLIRQVYGERITQGTGCCDAPPRTAPQARTSFGCGDPLALMDLQPGQTVLDVGSGPGADAIAAARRVGPEGRVIGVDMTEAMLAKAREAASAAGLGNVEFRAGDAEALPAEDASVDWVISNCVVNLVPDKEKAFREIFRALRPGGRFSITDLVGENLPDWILGDPGKYCACIGGAPSEAAYLEAARRAGFEDLVVTDRFPWEAPELEGTGGRVWSIKVTGRRPAGVPAGEAVIESARARDRAGIEELLARCGLPTGGVEDHLDRFLLARDGAGRVIGCSGLEVYGASCVLRSLAVSPEARGRGLGRRLLEATLDRARAAGCTEAYLLTLTIEKLAERHGFRRIARGEVAAPALGSREFSAACCASAAVMHRRL